VVDNPAVFQSFFDEPDVARVIFDEEDLNLLFCGGQ